MPRVVKRESLNLALLVADSLATSCHHDSCEVRTADS